MRKWEGKEYRKEKKRFYENCKHVSEKITRAHWISWQAYLIMPTPRNTCEKIKMRIFRWLKKGNLRKEIKEKKISWRRENKNRNFFYIKEKERKLHLKIKTWQMGALLRHYNYVHEKSMNHDRNYVQFLWHKCDEDQFIDRDSYTLEWNDPYPLAVY